MTIVVRVFLLMVFVVISSSVAKAGSPPTSMQWVPRAVYSETHAPTNLLTLHLRAVRNASPPFDRLPESASDIRPGIVAIQVPLYPRAAVSAAAFLNPNFSVPLTRYMKAGWAEYMLPAAPETTEAWYRDNFVQQGYVASASGTTYIQSSLIESEVSYSTMRNPDLVVQLLFRSVGHGQTLMLYLAVINTAPPRAPGSYLAHDTDRVAMAFTPLLPGGRTIHRVIANPRDIATLIALFNALPRDRGAGSSCPNIIGYSASLTFERRGGGPVLVTVGLPCDRVLVSGFPPLVDVHERFWSAVVSLAHL